MSASDNRWWEFYFVRYFVGTAIGAIVVLFLATASSPVFIGQGELAGILKTLKTGNFESGYIAVLATLGLAFCYIASAPILVLHAVRGYMLKASKNANWLLTTFFLIIVLAVWIAQGYVFWSILNVRGNPFISQDFYSGLAFLLVTSILIVGQLFLILRAIFSKKKYAFLYYDRLVKRRAVASLETIQYVESYRHLREHGNAFFIVLLELLLGATLFYSPVPWSVVLMIWILPAALVWFFGTLMESRNF